ACNFAVEFRTRENGLLFFDRHALEQADAGFKIADFGFGGIDGFARGIPDFALFGRKRGIGQGILVEIDRFAHGNTAGFRRYTSFYLFPKKPVKTRVCRGISICRAKRKQQEKRPPWALPWVASRTGKPCSTQARSCANSAFPTKPPSFLPTVRPTGF